MQISNSKKNKIIVWNVSYYCIYVEYLIKKNKINPRKKKD